MSHMDFTKSAVPATAWPAITSTTRPMAQVMPFERFDSA